MSRWERHQQNKRSKCHRSCGHYHLSRPAASERAEIVFARSKLIFLMNVTVQQRSITGTGWFTYFSAVKTKWLRKCSACRNIKQSNNGLSLYLESLRLINQPSTRLLVGVHLVEKERKDRCIVIQIVNVWYHLYTDKGAVVLFFLSRLLELIQSRYTANWIRSYLWWKKQTACSFHCEILGKHWGGHCYLLSASRPTENFATI